MVLGLSSSEVELRVKLSHLPNEDLLSKTDAFVIVSGKSGLVPNDEFVEIGRSEVVRDSLDPEFVTSFQLSYFFEEQQTIQVKVYDEDKKGSNNLRNHTFLGEAQFYLGSLMASTGQAVTVKLSGPKVSKSSTVTVHADELALCSDYLRFQLKGMKLANKDGLFGKSDPFYVFYRIRENGEFIKVYQSERIDNNLSPLCAIASLSVRQICNGDYDGPLNIEIFDWDQNGGHDSMGAIETSLRQLLVPNASFDVIEAKKKATKGYKNSGTLQVQLATLYREPSFLDYLKGGSQVSLVVAIDFTGSNGDPSDPSSLHFLNINGQPNQYQQAICSIGPIVEAYDSDKLFPVYGFGGQPGVGQPVSHCFGLVPGLEVPGIQGVLNTYAAALPIIRLSGPTLFAPIISAAMARASEALARTEAGQPLVYTILLLLTDGTINDLAQTQSLLNQASGLPLSIIIVGVGNADFSQMNQLDGDDAPRKVSGARDIVQFVAMNEYRGKGAAHLAKDVLAEVPGQFLAFTKAAAILPSRPLSPTSSSSARRPQP